VPLYLNVAMDTYLKIKASQQRAPSPSDFGRTKRKVREQFLRNLDRSEIETLKVLSVARFWDRELFESLIREFNTGYSATALPELRRFSFVQEVQIPSTWTIHPLMREALEERLDAELRGRVHRFLFDYYSDSLKELESTAISDADKMVLTEAFHHGRLALGTAEIFGWFTIAEEDHRRHALTTSEFFDWFATAEEVFSHAALWQFLIPLYEEFARLIEDRVGTEHPYTAHNINNLAELYRAQGRFEEAEPLYQKALDIDEKMLRPEQRDAEDATIVKGVTRRSNRG
jgi:tetratricopeptide (TPR) repeat protein